MDPHDRVASGPLVHPPGHVADGLNRVRKTTLPLDRTSQRKEIVPTYNRAGALEKIDLDGTLYVRHIAYNAKGQRTLMAMYRDDGPGQMDSTRQLAEAPEQLRSLYMDGPVLNVAEAPGRTAADHAAGTDDLAPVPGRIAGRPGPMRTGRPCTRHHTRQHLRAMSG